MMKGMFKRALAGVAAAVLAVTGMAAMTGAANAADGDMTITIKAGDGSYGVIEKHTFAYVKIADYVGDVPTDRIATVGTTAVDNDIYDAVLAAVNATFSPGSVPAGTDPLVWAQASEDRAMGDNSTFPWTSDEDSRDFADNLVRLLNTEDYDGVQWTAANTDADPDADGFQINTPAPGLYLIVDTTTDEDTMGKVTATLPMLVGTENSGLDNATGEIVMKNQRTDTPPEKDVDGEGANNTVTQGQTLGFTIKGSVPATAGAENTYAYTFSDYASNSISIQTTKGDAETNGNIKVYYMDNGSTDPATDPAKHYLTTDQFTVGVPTGHTPGDTIGGQGVYVNADSTPTFTVSVAKSVLDGLQDYAGNELGVEYDATVLTTVTTVENDATITSGENTSMPGNAPDLTTYDLKFTKVNADGDKLEDADFMIQQLVDGRPVNMPGTYGDATATSDKDGVVTFDNLADGKYRITETETPDDAVYENLGLYFDVEIKTTDGVTTVTVLDEGANNWVDLNYDLVTGGNNGATIGIEVKNITSITQLPVTGAAGITMFIVLGLLIAGAGVTVYMKSRGVRNAMRA